MATLVGGNFDGADFKDAELHHAVIAGVDLSHARGLTQDQVDDACGDARTRLPKGLTLHACGGARRSTRARSSGSSRHRDPRAAGSARAPGPAGAALALQPLSGGHRARLLNA